MKKLNKSSANLIISTIIFVVLFVFYGICHSKIHISSDTTTTFPMAMDIANGNIWLNDWVLGTNNFYFTETILFAIGHIIGFSSKVLIQFLPAIPWALMAALIPYFLDIWNEKSKKKLIVFWGLFISFLVIIPFSGGYTLLNANSHNNLYAFEMIWLLILKKYIADDKSFLLVILAIFSGILYFSESVILMTLFAPVGCVCLYQILFKKNKKWVYVLGALVIGFVVGKAIYFVFSLMGGMDTRGLPVGIVKDGHLVRLRDWITQFGILMGVGDINMAPATPYVLAAKILIFIYAISLVVYTIGFNKISWENQILFAIVVINLAASEFTNVAVFHRYIVPGWYFGWILCILMISDIIAKIKQKYISTFSITIVSVFGAWMGIHRIDEYRTAPIQGAGEMELATFIKENNLGSGYGDFWLASSTSFYTDYDIDIYPVRVNPDSNSIVAYEELIRKDWYSNTDIHYILTYEDPNASSFINHDAMISICGEPDQVYNVAGFGINYWEKDISQYMNNGFYDGIIENNEMRLESNSKIEGDYISIDPQGVVSGPGTIITEGAYTVTISGDNLEALNVTAYSEYAAKNYELLDYKITDQILSFNLKLKKEVSDLRIGLKNDADIVALIEGMQIQEG